MKTASISITKNQLSALIERVRHGETILITDDDRPVAKLMPVTAEDGTEPSGELALLERRGVIRRGLARGSRLSPPPEPRGGASAVAALLEERETGR